MKTLKITWIFLATIILHTTGFSQEKPNHKIKSHTSEEGKLYWNKDLPLYIFVADNPEGNDVKKLESEDQPQYANPVFLDTEGVNWIRTKWAVDPETRQPVSPQMEVMFEIYRDGNAPKTTINFSGADKFVSGGTTYFGKGLNIQSQVYDKYSGVENTFYSANGSAYSVLNGEINVTHEGENTYKFYAVDNVGNAEETSAFNFTLDVTAPQISLEVDGDFSEDIVSPRSKINLTGKDNLSGVQSIYWTLDNGKENRYKSGISLSGMSEGTHTLTYRGVDNVGNDSDVTTYEFYLDKTAPDVQQIVEGNTVERNGKVYVSDKTRILFSATDNKAGVDKIFLRVDDGGLMMFEDFLELPAEQGQHKLVYYAVDKVNNDYQTIMESTKKSDEVIYVDVNAPELDYTLVGSQYNSRDTTFLTSETQISLTVTDEDSGVKRISYSIDGGEQLDYNEPFVISSEGVHTVVYYGEDEVGNAANESITFIVDNTGPNIESILSMEKIGKLSLDELSDDLEVYSKGVKLYLGATDNMIDTDKIYLTLNDEESAYNIPRELNKQGIISFRVRAVDKLGNESVSDLKKIFIK